MSEELEELEQKELAIDSKNLDGVEVTDYPKDADIEKINELKSKLYEQVDEALLEDILNHLRNRTPNPNSPLADHIIWNVIHNIQMQELNQTLLQADAENTEPSKPSLLKRSSSLSSATPTSLLRDNVVPNELMHEALEGEKPLKPANLPSVPDQEPPPSNSPSFVDAMVAESNRQYEKDRLDREKRQSAVKHQRREKLSADEGELDEGDDLEPTQPREIFKRDDALPQTEPPSQPEPLSTGVVAPPENDSQKVTGGGKKRRKKTKKKKKSKKRKTKRRYKRGKRN